MPEAAAAAGRLLMPQPAHLRYSDAVGQRCGCVVGVLALPEPLAQTRQTGSDGSLTAA